MQYDLLIEHGTLVDGTGAAPNTADIAVRDGKITAIGRTPGELAGNTRETVDAKRAWVTPGFIDIHTHYDGQATWDDSFSPSIHHGVTTVVMGNSGVGFAPVRPVHDNDLDKLMEGVEDIPGAATTTAPRMAWGRPLPKPAPPN